MSIKLNIGCGRNILQGWVNIDQGIGEGVDITADLDNGNLNLVYPNNSVGEFLLSHVIEHIHKPLPLMQELHRVAKPGAIAIIKTPYGSSDDAWEDPTHVRPYFPHSFGYFSQPFYWKVGSMVGCTHEGMQGKRLREALQRNGFLFDALPETKKGVPVGVSFVAGEAKTVLQGQGLQSQALRQESMPRSLATEDVREGTNQIHGSRTSEGSGRQSEVLEGRLYPHFSSTGKDSSRASFSDGEDSRAETPPMGECASQERQSRRQQIGQSGTMGEVPACGPTCSGHCRMDSSQLSGLCIAGNGSVFVNGYGYRGDWQVVKVQLLVETAVEMAMIRMARNVVKEMVATLEAVKPIREPKRELQEPMNIQVVVMR